MVSFPLLSSSSVLDILLLWLLLLVTPTSPLPGVLRALLAALTVLEVYA